jgi:hypothetical protein
MVVKIYNLNPYGWELNPLACGNRTTPRLLREPTALIDCAVMCHRPHRHKVTSKMKTNFIRPIHTLQLVSAHYLELCYGNSQDQIQ